MNTSYALTLENDFGGLSTIADFHQAISCACSQKLLC